MLSHEDQALRDIVLAAGICDEEQVQEIIDEHERTGKSLSELVVNYEIASGQDILELIAQNLGTELIDLSAIEIEKEVIDLVSPDKARMYSLLPLAFDGTTLTVVYKNPLNYQIADELHFALGLDVFTVVASDQHIEEARDKYYPADIESISAMLEEMDLSEDFDRLDEGASDNDIMNLAADKPIVKFVNIILYQAIKDRASDIHF